MSKAKHDKKTSEYEEGRRPRFNFNEMGIPIGAKLVSNKEGMSTEIYVLSDRKVKTADSDEEISLCQATREILKVKYKIRPCRYWKYEGKVLSDYYNKAYPLRN